MSASTHAVPQIDEDAAKILAVMQAANRPAMETLTPEQGRKAFAMMREAMKQPKPEMAEVKDISVPGPAGEISLRLYRSHGAGKSPSPVLVFYHGGGWVLGDLESHDVRFSRIRACLTRSNGHCARRMSRVTASRSKSPRPRSCRT